MSVALTALDATVHTRVRGERAIAVDEFYLLPGNTPQPENVLAPGELITHVTLPALASGPGPSISSCATARRTSSRWHRRRSSSM